VASRQARILGSPHHTVTWSCAAIAPVHLSLIPLSAIARYKTAFASPTHAALFANSRIAHGPMTHQLAPPATKTSTAEAEAARPAMFGSESSRWGTPRVGITEVPEWETFRDESTRLVGLLNGLLHDLQTKTTSET
jgi:hypothetical protein